MLEREASEGGMLLDRRRELLGSIHAQAVATELERANDVLTPLAMSDPTASLGIAPHASHCNVLLGW